MLESFLKRYSLKYGDIVLLEFEGEEFQGTVLPDSNPHTLVLKLSNGYNAGFELEKISKVKKLGSGKKAGKPVEKKIKQTMNSPKISILHLGGTVASRVNYERGGVIASFTPSELLSKFPELLKIAQIKPVFIENIMSEDILFSHYSKLARVVKEEIESGVDGIIVTHGTDTLHYSAAALSFIFSKLPIPVLFVGSQRSSDRPSSDAADNLLNAAFFIASTDFAGCAVCMHDSSSDGFSVILPGTRTRKMHSSRRDAFRAINAEPIAKVNWQKKTVSFFSRNFARKKKVLGIELLDKFEPRVGILYAHPNLLSEEIDFFRKNKYKGLVLMATGIGHMPINTRENERNLKALSMLIKSGCIVCVTTQCIYGRVHENIYTNTRRLHSLGALFLEDMLPETAFIKLAWLLGNEPQNARELMVKNLRGELSERRLGGEFKPC